MATRFLTGSALLIFAAAVAAAAPAARAQQQTQRIGKLFTSSGTCSASVVTGKNIIVTAAHCCWNRSNNSWIGGWSFAPGYNNGKAPFGVFNWADARVPNSWINNGDIPSDVCLIRLQNDSSGHGVSYYVGWLGRAWNYPANQNMTSFGYPGNIGGANSLERCAAPSSAQPGSCGSNVLNMACNMTYGSSGGPWVMDWGTGYHVDSTVHGYINQNCTGAFGQEFDGPQFNSNNILLLCNAEGC
jgi:V8-like Glu-specific endopeptidase